MCWSTNNKIIARCYFSNYGQLGGSIFNCLLMARVALECKLLKTVKPRTAKRLILRVFPR